MEIQANFIFKHEFKMTILKSKQSPSRVQSESEWSPSSQNQTIRTARSLIGLCSDSGWSLIRV